MYISASSGPSHSLTFRNLYLFEDKGGSSNRKKSNFYFTVWRFRVILTFHTVFERYYYSTKYFKITLSCIFSITFYFFVAMYVDGLVRHAQNTYILTYINVFSWFCNLHMDFKLLFTYMTIDMNAGACWQQKSWKEKYASTFKLQYKLKLSSEWCSEKAWNTI